MTALTYEQRRDIAARIVEGVEHECHLASHGFPRRMRLLAYRLGVTERALRHAINPARKRPPSRELRVELERVSARWPRPIRAAEWLA